MGEVFGFTPLFISIQCDEDGWVLKPNREEEYPVFFHLMSPAEIIHIKVFGDIEISYFGFGDESKEAAMALYNVVLRNAAGTSCRLQPDLHLPRGTSV
jgi:hypothetical protein